MRPRVLTLAAFLLLLTPLVAFGQVLTASLTGAAEVGGGDTDGRGSATIFFNPAHTVMFVEVEVCNLAAPTGTHIHAGAAGVNGGVYLGLPGNYDSFGRLRFVVPITSQQYTDITTNPTSFYVNVHTGEFPGGAIRGQLSPAVGVLSATLLGSNEVGTAGGDPDGTGSALIVFAPTKAIAFVEIQVSNIGADTDITGAHIHTGAAGVNGGVLINLKETDNFSGGVLRRIVTTTPDTVASVMANPAGFYVNVHTSTFPGGAIRGQLETLEKPGDADGDNALGVGDIFYMINYIFAGGPPPPQ